MLNLNNVDLTIIDCVNPEQAVNTLEICTDKIHFASVKLFTHNEILHDKFEIHKIDNISSIEQYSDFCLTLNKYFNNDFVLLVQNDGFIVNPYLWDDNFTNYDYIGAPWELTKVVGQKVGNGGFSLRSKKFLEFSALFSTTGGVPEDNFLCIDKFHEAIEFGIDYAPVKLASKFAHEYRNPYAWSYNPKNHFGFHGKHNIEAASNYILKIKEQSIVL
jgi:hypothetical protein